MGAGKAKSNHFKGTGRRIQFNVAVEEGCERARGYTGKAIIPLLMTQVLCVASSRGFHMCILGSWI